MIIPPASTGTPPAVPFFVLIFSRFFSFSRKKKRAKPEQIVYIIYMNEGRQYEWDEAKRQSNRDKHGLDFAAIHRFDWETAIIAHSPRPDEDRWTALGFIDRALCCVVYTQRHGRLRLISLRKASRKERQAYATQ